MPQRHTNDPGFRNASTNRRLGKRQLTSEPIEGMAYATCGTCGSVAVWLVGQPPRRCEMCGKRFWKAPEDQ